MSKDMKQTLMEVLETEVTKSLPDIKKWVADAGKFSVSQVPLYIKELLKYTAYKNIVNIFQISINLLFVLVGVGAIILEGYIILQDWKNPWLLGLLPTTMVIVGCSIRWLFSWRVDSILSSTIKALVAPRVFLLDYLRGREK